MAVRCVRCGEYLDDYKQLCDACSAEKVQASEDLTTRSILSSSITCPGCSNQVHRSADACPTCENSFVPQAGDWRFAEPIGFGARFVASLIDAIITQTVIVIYAVLSGDPLVAFFIGVPVAFIYSVVFIAAEGATPGKMVMRIRVVTDQGHPPTIGHAIARYAMWWALPIGVFLIFFSSEKKALHDIVAGTIVVRADYFEQAASVREDARAKAA